MLFLALLPADMLPPAGHRARPGRSHGPHRPLRTARRAPRTLPRSGAAADAEARAALQSSSNSTSAASRPAPSSRPLGRGPGPGGRAGTGPESQCGQNPGLESSGQEGPGVSPSRQRFPRSIISLMPMLQAHIQRGVPGEPRPATGAVVYVYLHSHRG